MHNLRWGISDFGPEHGEDSHQFYLWKDDPHYPGWKVLRFHSYCVYWSYRLYDLLVTEKIRKGFSRIILLLSILTY